MDTEARCEINRFSPTSYKLQQLWPLVLHHCFPLSAHSHPVVVFFQCAVGDILAIFFSISDFWKQSRPPPPSPAVLYFLTVSVPPFHCLCSRPLVRWAKSSYSQLDPIGLISPTVYLFAFRCLISWGVVHLSPSTKHWLSVYFKPLFTRGKLAEHLSPPPALHVTFVRIYSHSRRPHSLLSATEPVIVWNTLRNSWPLLALCSNYLMNGSLLCFLQYFTLDSRGQTWKQLVTL